MAARRAIERTLHREIDRDARVVELHGHSPVGPATDPQRLGLDRTKQVEYTSILQPHLIIEKAPELIGEEPDGGLRPLAGIDPIEMDAAESPVLTAELLDVLEQLEQVSEFRLLVMRQQEIVESLETAPLIGFGDIGATTERLVEQGALRSGPAGDLLSERAVESAEVLLYLTEVGEELPCRACKLLIPVALAHCVQH